ncbi:MAG: response regulator transcription factor [Chitinophagaceae bacterium]|nr:response regulator transcription factor [Chitinophagaceae bacterium]
MQKIQCAIADDEQLSRDILKTYIEKTAQLQLSAECKNGIEVFDVLKSRKVDLLFLDIQMPMLTGIELLKTMLHPPKVILVTAYREFALEGYELNVLDYLLKPVSFIRFLKAVDKYPEPAHEAGLINLNNPTPFIDVRSEKKTIRISLPDIVCLEGMKDYVRVQTTTAAIITHQTLQYFEELLPKDQFIRVHRSYIIALGKVAAFTPSWVEVQGKEIPIGAFYQQQVMMRLEGRT